MSISKRSKQGDSQTLQIITQTSNVTDYYYKNVSWQDPGRKDRVILHELIGSGEKVKKKIQSRYVS